MGAKRTAGGCALSPCEMLFAEPAFLEELPRLRDHVIRTQDPVTAKRVDSVMAIQTDCARTYSRPEMRNMMSAPFWSVDLLAGAGGFA